MAWNKPGGGGRNVGGGFGQFLNKLPDFGGGGGPLRWAAILLGLWLVFNCFVLVAEQQRGVVLRFGQFDRIMQPGPNFKMPWPIERVIKVNATQIKNYEDRVPVLTSDENIVEVAINVQYKAVDAKLYLFGTRDGDEVLRQAALSTVRELVGRSKLDTVLGAREQLSVAARDRLQKSLEAYRTGLTVTELNLPDARPPQQVKPAFDDVNSAQQDQQRLISEARAYAAKIVPEARGQAARVRTVAEGYKTAEIARATGDAERFSLLVAQYKGAPEVTRKRLWLETVQDVLAKNRKVVGGDGRQLIYVPMDASSATPAPQAPVVLPDMTGSAPQATTQDNNPARPGRSGRSTGRDEVVR
ncbi:MAG: FtsH protease activity modulator HflK [Thermomonas sp.]|jgi:membrane protease subunit HflK|uniref:FtsH protease activity modulator HflK n=1 Tax=Thermomonas sp. TaxID=1971895 RepID=UPI001EB2830D|nr:FtsH protease activity modulator HflK [Thermomonas sp.]MBV2208907.1 FtsH protease activity modulator HflK [Thermomonas sp.]